MGKYDPTAGLSFHEWMETYNPFAFKKEDGTIMMFKEYEGAYFELLDRLFVQFPKGYIDLVLFCIDNLGMDKSYATEFLRNFQSEGCNTANIEDWSGECLVGWRRLDNSDIQTLECIARGMHWITETKFNKDMFRYAVNMLKAKYNL